VRDVDKRPSAKSKGSAARKASGIYLDIVKKGYARDVESRQSSTLVPAHRDRVHGASRWAPILCALGILGSLTASLGSGLSRCNWSFYGDVHRAEKEQATSSRRKAGVSAGFLRWALLMRAIK
jgi:hypothetical protein